MKGTEQTRMWGDTPYKINGYSRLQFEEQLSGSKVGKCLAVKPGLVARLQSYRDDLKTRKRRTKFSRRSSQNTI